MASGGGSPHLYLLIFLTADLCWLIVCVCGGIRKERKLNCLSVCLCTLIFYVRTLSDVSLLIWMPLMDGRCCINGWH
jgi:hypothetical protein